MSTRTVTKDGRIITCEWFNTPLMDPDGRFVGVISLAQDITERMRAEEALRESEERFRGTFDNAAVGIAHKDADGRFLRVNETYCGIVGYTRESCSRGPSRTSPTPRTWWPSSSNSPGS